MKILYISTMFYPEIISGGQVSSFNIVKSIANQNHEVYVLTLHSGKKLVKKRVGKINLIQVPKIKFIPIISNLDLMWAHLAFQSLKYIKQIKPNLIHLFNFEPSFYTPIIVKLFFPKLKIINTVNGPLFGCYTQNAIDYKKKTCLKCKIGKRFLCSINKWGLIKGFFYYVYGFWYMGLLKISYKFIDKFILVSESMRPLMTNMGVHTKKQTVIYNPFKTKIKKLTFFDKKELIEKYNLKNYKIILFAGRLGKEKGIDKVILSIKELSNVKFLIVGNKRGDYTYFKKLVKNLKLEKRVHFLGFLKHSEVEKIYQVTDLVVLPEFFYEPLSRLLIEAGLNKIPVIATKKGGNEEIIKDKKTGILLENPSIKEIKKAITNILEDPFLKKKMGEQSRKTLKNKVNSTKIANQYLEEYKS